MAEEKVSLKAIKIALLGDSTVGKSTIVTKYLKLDYKDDLLATIGSDKYDSKFTLENGENIKLIIWDTAGQERFRSVALQALKAVQGIILVFDLTKRESFININNWLETVRENLHNPNLILFGNKADIKKEDWKVTSEEAKNFAVKLNMKYVETSAYTRQGLDEGFSSLINDTYNKVKGKNDDSGKIEIKKDNNEDEYVTGCFGKKKKKKKKAF
jgi:small GTP-binding protein